MRRIDRIVGAAAPSEAGALTGGAIASLSLHAVAFAAAAVLAAKPPAILSNPVAVEIVDADSLDSGNRSEAVSGAPANGHVSREVVETLAAVSSALHTKALLSETTARRPPAPVTSMPAAPDVPARNAPEPSATDRVPQAAKSKPAPSPAVERKPPEDLAAAVPLPKSKPTAPRPAPEQTDAPSETTALPVEEGIPQRRFSQSVPQEAETALTRPTQGSAGRTGQNVDVATSVTPNETDTTLRLKAGSSRDAPPRQLSGGRLNPRPHYPFAARRQGQEGRVLLLVQVQANGRPQKVTVKRSSGYRLLDRAAIEAVRNWRFRPAISAGAPVAGSIEVPITFRLANG